MQRPRGAEQGPHADRLQTQVCQHAGHLGLAGGRLDQARQNHLLKGPITTDRLAQSQAGIRPVQNVPQQGRALGGHPRADVGRACGGWRWRRWHRGQVQGQLVQSDAAPADLHQGRQLCLGVG